MSWVHLEANRGLYAREYWGVGYAPFSLFQVNRCLQGSSWAGPLYANRVALVQGTAG